MPRWVAWCLFLPYLLAVFVGTFVLFRVPPGQRAQVNLQPGYNLQHYVRQADRNAAWNLGGNLAVLAPIGLLLPHLTGHRLSVWHALLACLLASAGIESFQYLSGRRHADIDDVILNTIGGVLGYALGALALPRPGPSDNRRRAEPP